MLTTQDLFEARTHGYKTCRVPGLAVTAEDTVLVTVEARPDSGGDYSDNDVLLRRSTDGGETFEPFVTLVDHADYGPGPVNNLVMVSDHAGGLVHVVFCHDYARVFHMVSDDDGATWSDPREITEVFEAFRRDYPWRVVATGPGHGTRLRSGRLVLPVWLSDGSGTEMGPNHRGHRPSIVASVYSDDDGETWKPGGIVCRHGDVIEGVRVVNPSETVAVEASDGSVRFNLRSESWNNRRLWASSPDGAHGWRVLGFDPEVREPVCMASLVRRDWPGADGPGHVLFANPDTLCTTLCRWDPRARPHRDRANLTVRVSLDDCRSWRHARVLEPGPSGYSDLAVLGDGTILCIYECGIVERIHDDRYVRLARFDLDWVTGRA